MFFCSTHYHTKFHASLKTSATLNFGEMTNKNAIQGIFLSQFDTKKGNILYWSKGYENFEGSLEFKSLPAGVHDLIDDYIIFTVKDKDSGKLYYGCCYYRQNGFELSQNSKQLDRSLIKMFSLGVILNIELNEESNFDVITNYYFFHLQKLLAVWLEDDSESMDNLIDFYKDHEVSSDISIDNVKDTDINVRNKLNYYWMHWWKRLGPLIFPIWRSLMLNERLLILIPSGHDFDTINALCYTLTEISKACQSDENLHVKSLYTIGTSDLDHMSDILKDKNGTGYIACTTDSLLIYKEELYGKLLIINDSSNTITETSSPDTNMDNAVKFFDNNNKPILATQKDLEIFEWITETKLNESIIEWDHTLNQIRIEPKSWLQWFIDNIYFIFTANYIIPKYHFQKGIVRLAINSIDTKEVILSFFQEKIRTILQKINFVNSNETSSSEENFTNIITLTLEDLNELDLDCFSEQEFRFIETLISKKLDKRCIIAGGIKEYLQLFY